MSFFTALMDAYGGYGQGRQQRFQDQQQQTQTQQAQEQITQQQTQTDIEQQKWDQARKQLLQQQGIDPATGQPYVLPGNLTQARPNNQGKGGPATPEEQLALYLRRAQWFRQHGQPDTATDNVNLALGLQSGQIAQSKAAETLAREMQMVDYRNANPSPVAQQQLSWGQQYGPPGMRPNWLDNYYMQTYGYIPLPQQGAATATEGKNVTALRTQAGQLYNDYQQFYAKQKNAAKIIGTIPMLDPKTHRPAVGISAEDQTWFEHTVTLAIDQADDPQKAADAIVKAYKKGNGAQANPNTIQAITLYAKARAMKKRAESATDKLIQNTSNPPQQPQMQPGGSYGAPNPPPGWH